MGNPSKFALALLLSSAFVAAPSIVLAQAATPAPSPSANAPGNGVGDVVVVARKRAEVAQTVPETITALDANALKQQQIQGIRDIHTAVPAFSVAPGAADQFSPLYSLRGISMLNLGQNTDPTVGTYVDGVYQASRRAT